MYCKIEANCGRELYYILAQKWSYAILYKKEKSVLKEGSETFKESRKLALDSDRP